MKHKNIMIKILIIIAGILLVFPYLLLIWPWTVPVETEPQNEYNEFIPVITKGVFPFQLVYEIGGETKVIEDEIICEYKGVTNDDYDKYRWETSLSSGEKEIVLADFSKENVINEEDGTKVVNLLFDYGNGAYYMGDDKSIQFGPLKNIVYTGIELDDEGSIFDDYEFKYYITAEEAWEKYRLKIISFKSAPPIENEFVKR